MAKSKTIPPRQFQVHHMLYDNGDFAVAWGVQGQDPNKKVGMRWLGTPGYPNARGNPAWMVIDSKLSVPFLVSLVSLKDSSTPTILRVLTEIAPTL